MDEFSRLVAFVAESNRIEGILRPPTDAEVRATSDFVRLLAPDVDDVIRFVSVCAPLARLRNREGLDVRVGNHFPPPGGPCVEQSLQRILVCSDEGGHPFFLHREYEILHPFMDGNGRSGRALWLWGMRRWSESSWHQALSLGFLHTWYYQSLEHGS